jgi:hypothetical protein
MVQSLAYTANRGCPPGYTHRKSYYSSRGRYVEPRCIRSQSIYPEGNRTQTRKNSPKGTAARLGLTRRCPPGKILRAPYVRKFSSTVKRSGYNTTKKGRTVRVYPKASAVLVKAGCIKNRGLPGKGPRSGKGIGTLRSGELSKYGYRSKSPVEDRHAALRKAIQVYGALGVYRKLDAVAKYTLRTAPEAHKVFMEDRDWIKSRFSLKAF